MDAEVLKLTGEIEEDTPWPRPLCSACGQARVRFNEPEKHESARSLSLHKHDAWEPEWITGAFVVTGQCENELCTQVFVGSGAYRTDNADVREIPWEDRNQQNYSAFYECAQLYPHVLLMRVPESAPIGVKEAVHRAGRVFLGDHGLAATALRSAVERFLTDAGVAGRASGGGFIPAQRRIETWRDGGSGRDSVADLLEAVKWLGNAGTHEDGDLTAKEVLEGVEILDEAFHRLYTGRDVDLRAQQINLARGPRRSPGSSDL